MTGFTASGLRRLHDVLARHVDAGQLPGLVALVSRHGETHVEMIGELEVDGGSSMQRDTIFRIASSSKPIAAAAAMLLVEDCVLRLDDPIDEWMPELAGRRVLRHREASLDDTVPGTRSITLRDLLTFGCGYGIPFSAEQPPILRALAEAELMPSEKPPVLAPDEYVRRLGELPLMHQPGEGWLYNHGLDIASVLMARASGGSLDALLRERLFRPLGMRDTGFWVPPDRIHRLPTSYVRAPASNPGDRRDVAIRKLPDKPAAYELAVRDEPRSGAWSRPPTFESGGGGLVSTVDDYAAFLRMLLDKGLHEGQRVLSRASVELMTSNQLAPGQGLPLGDDLGWGFGGSVVLRRRHLGESVGMYGWLGGSGTTTYVDPREALIHVFFSQRLMESPAGLPWMLDFTTATYAALAD